ncbi:MULTISPECIES: 4'-phosphopantetheinyl transferase family protein [Chryseobacterium]|uniref:4'-phosphopantetheinyl transferase n=1 Tax=Chryseobacterium camelliae TaxID=1265445 RepID=A0ABU0TK18_9FLAO|nr:MULTISPECIES: 4'-phosphopantetheinyl transferase superfamily protein [Chryseobacterium]MDT3408755.1 4'-phosphopantetheinyl transferase [Pseudacidovorax intermedius]MDQ1097390.1 4'-phosphopantetheinyl transferase [Chryseobacterium camelliae]MDQ1101321.1 4'-phosphopantetheinyl transferase [Chryseobacterium sp. SORGH_AS_1048]MDR6084766.1 4'-phosphopantetheinyl transferase [Chryseobacterium sp. SORGH_AS_0909]MDR6133040.1 4'-phosphopantetheinyl transferase [Chryseobacterium sp. SORGH_AS_1175]
MEIWVAYSFPDRNDEERLEALFAQLPAPITEPVNRYRNPADRKGRIISKLLLETLVRKHFPHQGFSWDRYRKDALSKPYMQGLDICFSTSHHDALSIVCITSGKACGVDSELARPVDPELYHDFLHPHEKDLIASNTDQATSFYKIWTRKEAILKALGVGISYEMNSIDAHKDIVMAGNHSYVTTPLFLSASIVTHLATPEAISTLHLEEISF